MHTRNRNLVLAFLAASCLLALAAEVAAADSGGYIGIAAGQSRAKVDRGGIDAIFTASSLTASTTIDETGTAFKIYGGYQISQNIAIEGGYSDLGKSKFHSIVTSGGSGTGDGEWRAYSIDISALGILPLGDQFSLFGRAGLGIWNLDFKFTASGPGGTGTVSESESGVSPLLGIGATFNFTPQFSLRGEIERHFSVGKDDTTGKSDIDLITLGLQFRF